MGLGGSRLPQHSQRQEPTEDLARCSLGTAASAWHPLCAQLCPPGAGAGAGGGSALLRKEAGPVGGRGDCVPAPAVVWSFSCSSEAQGARPAVTEGPGGEGCRLCSGLGLGASPHPPLGPSSTVSGNVKWFNHFGKHLAAFSKVKHTPSIWSGHSPPRHLSQRNANLGPLRLGHECS